MLTLERPWKTFFRQINLNTVFSMLCLSINILFLKTFLFSMYKNDIFKCQKYKIIKYQVFIVKIT